MIRERPFRSYAENMVELGIWFTCLCVERSRPGDLGDRALSDVLSRWVNLYRLTTWWDGLVETDVASGWHDPAWERTLVQLREIVRAVRWPETREAERRALELLKPVLAENLNGRPLGVETFGCWHYVPVGAGIADGPGAFGQLRNWQNLKERGLAMMRRARTWKHVELHFWNARMPQSPFAEPLRLAADLRQLLADVEKRHPAVGSVWCNTWLNSHEVFGRLFPECWHANAQVMTLENSGGLLLARRRLNTDNWWGQFRSRTGGFNRVLGERFRQSNGVFPYPTFKCHAPIDVMIDHLDEILVTHGEEGA